MLPGTAVGGYHPAREGGRHFLPLLRLTTTAAAVTLNFRLCGVSEAAIRLGSSTVKVVTTEQMRRAEQHCARAGTGTDELMENAGRAVADAVISEFKGREPRVLVLAGPGNNGGDGLVAGRYLHDRGLSVRILVVGERSVEDRNVRLAMERGIDMTSAAAMTPGDVDAVLSTSDVVIDALLGTGRRRPIEGTMADILSKLRDRQKHRSGMKVVAVDLPTGLDADSGMADPLCPYVDETITLGFPKVGLFNLPGAERAGRITVADIGIPEDFAESEIELMMPVMVRSILPERPRVSNKGTFGKVMVVAGSASYTGAAFLSSEAAARGGAGLVTLAVPSSLQPILASKLTEVTYLRLPEVDFGIVQPAAAGIIERSLEGYRVLLMGPGLGRTEEVSSVVRALALRPRADVPSLVLDADALTILSETASGAGVWRGIRGDVILTPHPGEMARLTGLSVAGIQSDRVGLTRSVAREWNKIVVLKGAYTVVAAPDGRTAISPFANPGLATAGTGDVLAGLIAGLLAQGLAPFDAAVAGVFVHGEAGRLAVEENGDTGVVASDLLPLLPLAIKAVRSASVVSGGTYALGS